MTVPSEAKYTTLAAPTGGLDAYSSLASMPPQNAVALNNMVPFTWGVAVRKGFRVWAEGLGGNVHSLLPWIGAGEKLYAVANGNLFDVTAPVSGPTPVLTGLDANALWHHVQFSTAGGQYTIAVNGVDNPILLDGTATIRRLIAGDGTTVDTIAGADPATFSDVNIHQRRLWFVEKDTTVGWYLPPDSFFGTVEAFDFGPLFKRGGTLYGIYTWSVDTGEGSNDHLVALSTEGDAVVYAGIDVDTADAWSLKGVYFIGRPVPGHRIDAKVGGDLMLLTTVGVVSLNTVLTSTQVNATSEDTYSKQVQMLIADLVNQLGDRPYWELVYTPSNNLLMINVPQVFEGGAGQLCANQVNRAWCTFSGMDACSWLNWGGYPFFGSTNGTVDRAWDGFQDKIGSEEVISTPQPIKWRAQQAFNYLDAPALQKQVGLIRLNFLVGFPAEYATAVLYDFNVVPRRHPNLSLEQVVALWDNDLWDQGYWSGETSLQRRFDNPVGIGVAASIATAGVSVEECIWVSTDLSYKVGGLL